MIYRPNKKPPIWGIDPGIVAYNCQRAGMPVPVLAMPMWEGAGDRAFDLSGHGNHGDIIGADWITDGLDFKATPDYIQIDDGNKLGFEGASESFTISFCINPDVINAHQAIVYKHDSNDDFWRVHLWSDNKITGSLNAIDFSSATGVFTVGTWYHVVAVFNKDENGIIYINGAASGTPVALNNEVLELSTTYTRIGINTSFEYPCNCQLNNLNIFNAVVSPQQVKFISDNPYFMYWLPEKLYGYVVSGGIEVSATTDVLSLTENVVIVNVEVSISAGVDALVITENVATIKVDSGVQAVVDALILTENTATVNAEVSISAGIDILVLTEYQAIVVVDEAIEVIADIDALTLIEYSANVNVSGNVAFTANHDALVLIEYAAGVNAEVNFTTGLDSLTLAEYVVAVNIGTNISAGIDNLFISENAVNINKEINITVGIDALSIVDFAAEINVGVTINTGTDALFLSALAASVNNEIDIQTSLDALILTEYAASISFLFMLSEERSLLINGENRIIII